MMSEMISWELQYLAIVVTLGVVLAIVYDCIRVFRRLVDHGTIWIAIEDILFWMIAGIITFIICFIEDAGNVRLFAIAGEIIGVIMYHILISSYFVKTMVFILNFPLKLLKNLMKSFKL